MQNAAARDLAAKRDAVLAVRVSQRTRDTFYRMAKVEGLSIGDLLTIMAIEERKRWSSK
jgi:hypothetical protein